MVYTFIVRNPDKLYAIIYPVQKYTKIELNYKNKEIALLRTSAGINE